MNIVVLAGNLARDPEKSYTQSGMAITRFTIAVNRFRKSEGGDDADFIRITAFDKQAELVERYLKKGSKVGVEGRIQTGSYEKDGKKVYTTDVIANRVEFLDRKGEGGGGYSGGGNSGGGDFGGQFGGAPAPSYAPAAPAPAPAPAAAPQDLPDAFAEIDDDDMPF
ncbi:MAG: single-stranded DNA-binding protein [Clostridiales Family XIII bacterium]|jgi:single-strand DNA-binding protein|nr:single-stranded DNA-binding protein [Clostridiales Family XIII bacterium]